MKIDRAKLRGKPLDEDCKRANRTTNEYGPDDNRVYCLGLYTKMTDWEIREKCQECGAYVDNSVPLEKVLVYQSDPPGYKIEVRKE